MTALQLVHERILKSIKEGDFCIDATAGRGYDTVFLKKAVGESGKVIAIDIQQEAVDSTKERLEKEGLVAQVYCDTHANIDKYADEESVDCIVFNLGYLPKGDHKVNTKAESTICAIKKGLKLLKKGGLMCVTMYYGGDSGYEEKDALTRWLKEVDDRYYQVLVTYFYNWKKDPPIPVFIFKV